MIGIYDDPPPPECSVINSTRVASMGAIPLAKTMTKLRDRLFNAAGHLLP